MKANPSSSNGSSSDVITCKLSNCGCQCHISLAPPEERWYCVFVGTHTGPIQGREKALKTYQNVSGGYARYCLSKDEAEDMYREALQSSQVVLVKTPTRETLKLSQLSGLNGFRNGDPTGPEEASWMVVLVGRNPGVYLLDDVGTVGIQENIKFIKGARAVPYRLRSEAVEAFTLALKAGVVVMVDRGRDIRLPLTLNTTSVVDGEPFVKSEVDI